MSRFTCLIVDDDIDDHELFMDHVREISPSITCLTAYNGKEAIEKLTTGEYKPDVIFLDLNMPLVDGKQFLKTVKSHERLKHIPVIILSTSTNQQNKTETKELGAIDFMSKPYKLADWASDLKKIFQKYFPQVGAAQKK